MKKTFKKPETRRRRIEAAVQNVATRPSKAAARARRRPR